MDVIYKPKVLYLTLCQKANCMNKRGVQAIFFGHQLRQVFVLIHFTVPLLTTASAGETTKVAMVEMCL